MTIGNKIRELRESSGLLQRELAHRLNLGEGYLSKIESDQKKISREHLDTISQIFNEPIEDLESLWLGNKICDLLRDESSALEALKVAEEQLKHHKNGQ